MTAPLYVASQTKQEKTKVIASLVERVRRDSPGGGGFIKRDLSTGSWFEIGNDKARDKVGHAIRRLIDESAKKKRKMSLMAGAQAFNQCQMPKAREDNPTLFMEPDSFAGLSTNHVSLSSHGAVLKMDTLPSIEPNQAAVQLQNHQTNLSGSFQGFGTPNMHFPLHALQFDGFMRPDRFQQNQAIPSSAFIGSGSGKVDLPNFSQSSPNVLTGAQSSNTALQFDQIKQPGQESNFSSANFNKDHSQNTFNYGFQNLQKPPPVADSVQSGAGSNQPTPPDAMDPHSPFFPLDDAGLDELFSIDSGNKQSSGGAMPSQSQDQHKSGEGHGGTYI